ncbi:MAG: hypothetical protein JSR18_10915 [Proteobacteria bacterium]|nr:hypothetical protein [Pseudomonadota bacterium]
MASRLRTFAMAAVTFAALAATAPASALLPVAPAYPNLQFSQGQLVEGIDFNWLETNAFRMSGAYRATYATVSFKGTVLKICVHRTLISGTATMADTISVFHPALPAGEYIAEVSESTSIDGDTVPPCTLLLERTFVVLPQSALVDVIEFYNATLDHYFLTADPGEVAALDAGLFAGWSRTGYSFTAFAGDTPYTPDLVPVCRFYGRPEAGLDTHFYSASAADCAIVAATWPDQWILETSSAFKVTPVLSAPDVAGTCPTPARTYGRFYNHRPDVNHRYVKSNGGAFSQPLPAYDEMVAKGWTFEGSAWCAW